MSGKWLKFLTSMELAVSLLIMLAIGSVIGTIVPQNLPATDYLARFGPFWASVFDRLGVFDVYGSPWFAALLLFLLFSLSLCLIERLPGYLRQWRRQARSRPRPDQMRCLSADDPDRQRLIDLLRRHRLRVSVIEDGLGVWLLGHSRLPWRTVGYGLLHGGLLVILLGALIDTNPLLKLRLLTGQIGPAALEVMPDQAPESARLPPDSGAFRTQLRLGAGEKSDRVFLLTDEGYLIRKLPFVIALERFEIDYYANGMPSDFVSHVRLFSHQGRLLRSGKVRVNHPLQQDGYMLYQSSWEDGGSNLTFTAWRPWIRKDGLRQTLSVGESIFLRLGSRRYRLEVLDFRLHTVIHRTGGRTLNRGPRMDYVLTDETGRRLWFESYLAPQRNGEIAVQVLRMRDRPDKAWTTLSVPLHDRKADLFWGWLHQLGTRQGRSLDDLLIQLFANGGFTAVETFVEENFEPSKHRSIKKFYMGILLDNLNRSFERLDVRLSPQWRNEAIMAADALAGWRPPVWLQLEAFEQKLDTVLIVAHYPGKDLIWWGSLMLVAGIFIMLYTNQGQIWIHLDNRSGNQGQLCYRTGGFRPQQRRLLEQQLRGLSERNTS